jgi:secondary thiamine-phosphate synthase enzyme
VTRLIEREVPEIGEIEVGLLHVFIKHTSASLTVNENADLTVREDFEAHFDRAVPENVPYYRHTAEGPDDMPAHIKASLMGASVTIPISSGRLNLGTWQGIYLCEHRDRGGSRRLVVTAIGS